MSVGAVALSGGDQARCVRRFVRHERRAARFEARIDIALLVGDSFERAEVFHVRRRDGGDERGVRFHQAASAAGSRRDGSCRSRTRRTRLSRGMRDSVSGTPQ